MRSRTATWFECKVRYGQTQENESRKAVTKQYVVDALSFAEAEKRITEEMAPYISGEFEVTDVKKAAYKEIFFMGNGEKAFQNEVEEFTRAVRNGDMEKAREVYDRPLEQMNNTDTLYYKAKLQFITIDEKTAKEKRSNVTYLVEATSLHNALDNIDAVMKGTMLDYVQASVSETAISDVYEHELSKKTELIEKMRAALADPSKTTEEIVDQYVNCKTPELRQELIEKLHKQRKEQHGIDK